MELLRTEKTVFTEDEIIKVIEEHESLRLPNLQAMWEYYIARDPKILNREVVDANNPDNRTVVSYGRKIITTFKGYAYRPGFISYKSENEQFLEAIKETFAINSEKVKTSRTGRNMGIFGYTYELFYFEQEEGEKAQPRWINNDPRSLLVFHDHSPEPKKTIVIRYYPITKDKWIVEAMYRDTIITYDRVRGASLNSGEWKLENAREAPNDYGKIPVAAYYLGDEAIGIIKPVQTLIDDYDYLVSDSIIEFDKFAHAYLLLAKMSLTDSQKKESLSFSRILRDIKRKRVFERLSSTDDVKFLLKDTPVAFISWLAEVVRNEIHKQSHVPDFMSEKMAGALSGVAVARLMFDFENLVSSAEGDFNLGLMERLDLVVAGYKRSGTTTGEPADISVQHKRNVPQNVKEFAETAEIMKRTGFSSKLVAETMPDDIIPDIEAELEQQRTERNNMFGDEVGEMPDGDGERPLDSGSGDVQAQALNGAQIKSMVELTQSVSDKTMAPESAKALLLVAIPSLTKEQANAIIDPAAAIEKPPPPPVPPQFGQIAQPEPPEDE